MSKLVMIDHDIIFIIYTCTVLYYHMYVCTVCMGSTMSIYK